MTQQCPDIDHCHKIQCLHDHEWAGEWQLAEAIRTTCGDCDRSHTEKVLVIDGNEYPLDRIRQALETQERMEGLWKHLQPGGRP